MWAREEKRQWHRNIKWFMAWKWMKEPHGSESGNLYLLSSSSSPPRRFLTQSFFWKFRNTECSLSGGFCRNELLSFWWSTQKMFIHFWLAMTKPLIINNCKCAFIPVASALLHCSYFFLHFLQHNCRKKSTKNMNEKIYSKIFICESSTKKKQEKKA